MKSKQFFYVVLSLAICALYFLEPHQAFAQDGAVQTALTDPGGALAGTHTPFQFILGTVNFVLMAFFVYYVFVLRPGQLKEEEQSRFIRDLKKDDDVLTSGGLLGKAVVIQKEWITVDLGGGVKVRVHPNHIFSSKESGPNSASASGGASASAGGRAKGETVKSLPKAEKSQKVQ